MGFSCILISSLSEKDSACHNLGGLIPFREHSYKNDYNYQAGYQQVSPGIEAFKKAYRQDELQGYLLCAE